MPIAETGGCSAAPITRPTRRTWLLVALCAAAGCTGSATDAPPGAATWPATTFVARAAGQPIEARAVGAGVELSAPREEGSTWRILVGARSLSRGGDVTATAAADSLCDADGCTVARSVGVTERWIDGALGLEHIVEIANRVSGAGPLRVVVDVAGADVIATASRTELVLRPTGSSEALRYSGLDVRDARGRRLDAWLEARAGGLDFVVQDAAAAYPIVIDPYVSRAIQSLSASGWAVDVSGTTAVVGSTYDDLPGVSHAGTAIVYVPSGSGTYVEQAVLSAADPTPNSFFGIAVAISANTIAVGCTHGWDNSGNPDVGSVYVFVRSGTTWTQQAKLFETTGGPLKSYGYSLSLSGDTLAVGARWDDHDGLTNAGAVYVYTRTGTTWTLEQELTASDADNYDTFGFSVSLSGESLAVGSYLKDRAPNPDAGGVYVYTRAAGTWTEQAALEGAGATLSEQVGYAVALEGDLLVAGAPGLDGAGVTDRGGARVFTRAGTAWTEVATLFAADSLAGDQLGDSLALESGTLVMGASQADIGALVDAGAFYVFTGSGATWTERTKGQPTTPAAGALFGYALDHHLGTAFVGAPSPGLGVPQTYVMRIGLEEGDACTADTQCLSSACVDAVCCDTACGGGATNDCQACSVARGATTNGTCAPLAGGTACRASAGVCDVAEVCDGSSPACPADARAADGTACPDGIGCNGAETCAAGVCTAGAPPACDDSIACTTDACVEPGTCAHAAIAGCCLADADCDDGDACTTDACAAHVCVSTPPGACVDAGVTMTDAGEPATDAGEGIDAATPQDAGAAPSDAGSIGRDAAMIAADGGARDGGDTDGSIAPPPADDGGCGCSAAGAHSRNGTLLAMLALLPLGLRRRRRPRA